MDIFQHIVNLIVSCDFAGFVSREWRWIVSTILPIAVSYFFFIKGVKNRKKKELAKIEELTNSIVKHLYKLIVDENKRIGSKHICYFIEDEKNNVEFDASEIQFKPIIIKLIALVVRKAKKIPNINGILFYLDLLLDNWNPEDDPEGPSTGNKNGLNDANQEFEKLELPQLPKTIKQNNVGRKVLDFVLELRIPNQDFTLFESSTANKQRIAYATIQASIVTCVSYIYFNVPPVIALSVFMLAVILSYIHLCSISRLVTKKMRSKNIENEKKQKEMKKLINIEIQDEIGNKKAIIKEYFSSKRFSVNRTFFVKKTDNEEVPSKRNLKRPIPVIKDWEELHLFKKSDPDKILNQRRIVLIGYGTKHLSIDTNENQNKGEFQWYGLVKLDDNDELTLVMKHHRNKVKNYLADLTFCSIRTNRKYFENVLILEHFSTNSPKVFKHNKIANDEKNKKNLRLEKTINLITHSKVLDKLKAIYHKFNPKNNLISFDEHLIDWLASLEQRKYIIHSKILGSHYLEQSFKHYLVDKLKQEAKKRDGHSIEATLSEIDPKKIRPENIEDVFLPIDNIKDFKKDSFQNNAGYNRGVISEIQNAAYDDVITRKKRSTMRRWKYLEDSIMRNTEGLETYRKFEVSNEAFNLN